MCVYSMVIDYQRKHIHDYYQWVEPYIYPGVTPAVPAPWVVTPGSITPGSPNGPTQEDFDKLRNELEAMKKLLRAAEKFDSATGQPECESDEKVAFLKKLADLLDIDLSDVLP